VKLATGPLGLLCSKPGAKLSEIGRRQNVDLTSLSVSSAVE